MFGHARDLELIASMRQRKSQRRHVQLEQGPSVNEKSEVWELKAQSSEAYSYSRALRHRAHVMRKQAEQHRKAQADRLRADPQRWAKIPGTQDWQLVSLSHLWAGLRAADAKRGEDQKGTNAEARAVRHVIEAHACERMQRSFPLAAVTPQGTATYMASLRGAT